MLNKVRVSSFALFKKPFALILFLSVVVFSYFFIKNLNSLIPKESKTSNYYVIENPPFISFYEYKTLGQDTVFHGNYITKKDNYIQIQGKFSNGLKQGRFHVFNDNRHVTAVLNYNNDLLNDTSYFFSNPGTIGSYKVFSNDTLIKEVYLNDKKEDFLTFIYQNDSITNLTNTFVNSFDHSSTLNLNSDSTFTYTSNNKKTTGKFSFKYPYRVYLDSIPYFISILSENRILLTTFNSQKGLPAKFDGYNQKLLLQHE